MNVEMAIVVWDTGIAPQTCNKSHTKYGLQHNINTVRNGLKDELLLWTSNW